jgi:hypothetical protein
MTTTHALDAIKAFEEDYLRQVDEAAERAAQEAAAFTEKLRYRVQRLLDTQLPALVPFAAIDELELEPGQRMPDHATVEVRIPEHAPIFVYTQAAGPIASESDWRLGSWNRDGYQRVGMAVWDYNRGLMEYAEGSFTLGEVLLEAKHRFRAWSEAERRAREEKEDAELSPAPPVKERPLQLSKAEKALILALRNMIADEQAPRGE